MMANAKYMKIVCIGDGGVGKTSLLMTYALNEFPQKYLPTIFENYTTQYELDDGSTMKISLFDTAGQEDYDRLRPLSYPNTDVVLICFSVINRDSFENIQKRWFPEIEHYFKNKNTKWFLIGMQTDLREWKINTNSNKLVEDIVTTEEGEKMGKTIKASHYFECSALKKSGIQKIFDMAVLSVKNPKTMIPTPKHSCKLL